MPVSAVTALLPLLLIVSPSPVAPLSLVAPLTPAKPLSLAVSWSSAVPLSLAVSGSPAVPLSLAVQRSPAVPWSIAAARVDGVFRWPVTPPEVVRRFDPPPQPWLPGHRGVDLGSSAGAEVRAAAGGVVVHAQTLAGRGVVSVLHAGQLRTTYEPVTATVRAGDRVAAGDPIGVVETGHPGCAVAVCLHWGARRDAVYLDPLALLGLGRVRLLPLGAMPSWS